MARLRREADERWEFWRTREEKVEAVIKAVEDGSYRMEMVEYWLSKIPEGAWGIAAQKLNAWAAAKAPLPRPSWWRRILRRK